MDEVICACGQGYTMFFNQHDEDHVSMTCPKCGRDIRLKQTIQVIHYKYVYDIDYEVV